MDRQIFVAVVVVIVVVDAVIVAALVICIYSKTVLKILFFSFKSLLEYIYFNTPSRLTVVSVDDRKLLVRSLPVNCDASWGRLTNARTAASMSKSIFSP